MIRTLALLMLGVTLANAQPNPNRFADIQVLQYEVPGFDNLSLKQKLLVYYLSEAALAGRDIIFDQNCKYNLRVRKTIEQIVKNYSGDKTKDPEWERFMTWAKQVWFSRGIHHHYNETKLVPEFKREYFIKLVRGSMPNARFPLSPANANNVDKFAGEMADIIFKADIAPKRVNKAAGKDLVISSAANFYDGVTQSEAEDFYRLQKEAGSQENPVSHGLNSKLVKLTSPPMKAHRTASGTYDTKPKAGDIVEYVWCVGGKDVHESGKPGLYMQALKKVVQNLESALPYTENKLQKKALELLIEYFQTGDLAKFDEYNIAWLKDTQSTIDYILGFIEVYGDPLGYKGSYEGVIQITDMDASKRIKTLASNAQWFENNSPIDNTYKKAKVVGISAKVVNVAMEAGDAAPATPIGINLPNSNWIRTKHGSKSVSLENIKTAYNTASSDEKLKEFYSSDTEVKRQQEHGVLAGKLHTDLHEVVGHASGQLKTGVGQPSETLKNYSNTIEEARADLVALYYLMDQKLVEIGVAPSVEVGKAAYDSYITNGLITQLQRIKLGDEIEEDHMRNRQMIAAWVYEKGKPSNVIEKISKNGKTFFVVKDYDKLRGLFGELLKEVQRIKSEGDFEAAKKLVETYGVKIDANLHKEVLDRFQRLNLPAFYGFVQPRYKLVGPKDKPTDVKIDYSQSDFVEQMMEYGQKYSFLPIEF